MNKLRGIDENFQISSMNEIIGLRNLIIHGYDSVDSMMLWSILSNDVEQLRSDIRKIRS